MKNINKNILRKDILRYPKINKYILKHIEESIQIYISVVYYLTLVLVLFLITCDFIIQYQLLELNVDIYEHVLLTPEMENLYNQMEKSLFKNTQ